MISIEVYNQSMKPMWDEAVRGSKNGTFLHLRDYMDYHSDRFDDSSLLAVEDGKVVALLPACIQGNKLHSHAGLTYGGWIVPLRHFDVNTMMLLWQSANATMRKLGVSQLVYKPVPYIYHRYPAQEDLYAIFRAGGKITACNISSTIDLSCPLPFDRGNKRNINLAKRNNVIVGEDTRWDAFWTILETLLMEKYNTPPVHSLQEITMLKDKFPHNIKLYTATTQGVPIAGVVMYYSEGQVAHCQYISSTPQGRELKALPLLFDHLISKAKHDGYKYFDFGISCEQGGLYLNQGLATQKCRLGGRGVVYNTFTIDF